MSGSESLRETRDQGECSCGCGSRATLHERGFTVANLPDEEALKGLAKIEGMLRAAERDARLLDGRDFKARKWTEAYRLLGLLRGRAGG